MKSKAVKTPNWQETLQLAHPTCMYISAMFLPRGKNIAQMYMSAAGQIFINGI